MEQTPDRGPIRHREACFQTTPAAAARAGRASSDRAPARDVPELLDRFQQDFGSICPERTKKGFKFDPDQAARLMDSWMQIQGVTPAGRVEQEPSSNTVVVTNRPVWGDVSIWVDPGSVEAAMGGANLKGYVVSTPAQAQDAKRQGHWFLDPRHLPMNTSQEIEKAGRRPRALEPAAEPAAEPEAEAEPEQDAEPDAEPNAEPTLPSSLPKPNKDADATTEIVDWFENSVEVEGVAFSPMKDWTAELITGAHWQAGVRDKLNRLCVAYVVIKSNLEIAAGAHTNILKLSAALLRDKKIIRPVAHKSNLVWAAAVAASVPN